MQQTASIPGPSAAGLDAAGAGARSTTGTQPLPATNGAWPHAGLALGIVSAALVVERLSTTFYYTALTTPAILRHPQLAGRSGNPNNPGLPPDGNPHHVRYLQAALDAESKHAQLLTAVGATSRIRQFYFPAATFQLLGTSLLGKSFLGVLEQLETISIGLYLAAVAQLSRQDNFDLTQLAAEIAGVEAEHRMLGRVIADIKPANNLTLEKEPFATVADALTALRPYLSGHGFGGPSTRPLAIPSAAEVAHVVGKYGTRQVSRFL